MLSIVNEVSRIRRALFENREAGVNHLHIYARVDWRPIAVGDVLVLVTYKEGSAVAVYNLNTTGKIEGEVEARRVQFGRWFVEVEKASSSVRKRLHATITAEVEFQADWRSAPAINALARLRKEETSARIWQ